MTKSNKGRGSKKALTINKTRLAIIILAALVVIGTLSGVGLIVHASQDLPEVVDLKERLTSTSFIYNEDGTEQIAALHDVENRIIVDFEKMPEHLKEAFIATEDERFYTHFGVDMRAFGRAVYANVTDQSFAQGGSTITQQLARNTYLSREKIITRKIQEWVLAVQLERSYTKDDILEMYLNQVFLGYNAYGVEAASNLYFDKNIEDLTLAESAMLAGITRSPNSLSPHNHFDRAKARQETVLGLMVRNEFISEEEAEEAQNEEIEIVPIENQKYDYPYFVDYVLKELLDTYGPETVYRGGLKVYSTINTAMQKEAEQAFEDILDSAFPPTEDGLYEPQAALISVDPNTGYIKAIMGGRHHQEQMGLNRTLSPRQPGSAFKPVVVFAPAVEKGYSPATIVEDARITLRTSSSRWSPRNYNHRYIGPVSLREAAARSINTVAVRLIDDIGVDAAIETIQNLGITTLVLEEARLNDTGPAISLGGLTHGTSPMELNSAYGTFATGGKLAEPTAILKVVDRNGIVLEDNTPNVKQVLDPSTAYLVTEMLKDTIRQSHGTAYRNGNIGRPAAGKTGTTDDNRDAWFVGYTPDLVTTVWMGHDREKTMSGVYGGNYAARIWNRVMRVGHEGVSSKDFSRPNSVVSVQICRISGLPIGENCPSDAVTRDYFISGTVPEHTCDIHIVLDVCAKTGMLAGEHCEQVVQKPFVQWPESWNFTKSYDSKDIPTEMSTCEPPPPEEPEDDEDDEDNGQDKDNDQKDKDDDDDKDDNDEDDGDDDNNDQEEDNDNDNNNTGNNSNRNN